METTTKPTQSVEQPQESYAIIRYLNFMLYFMHTRTFIYFITLLPSLFIYLLLYKSARLGSDVYLMLVLISHWLIYLILIKNWDDRIFTMIEFKEEYKKQKRRKVNKIIKS